MIFLQATLCGLQVCRKALLAESGLQSLLQHLHQLLLPIIRSSSGAAEEPSQGQGQGQGQEQGQGQKHGQGSLALDCKQVLGVEEEDLDLLLAVLETLAAADAASSMHGQTQVD